METEKKNELHELLPGRYVKKIDRDTYVLFLEGEVEAPTPFGDSFSLMHSHDNGDDSGVSFDITGTYRMEGDKLVLDAEKISRESWTEQQEAEGEAFVRDYDKGPIIAEVDASGELPVLRMNAFGRDLEITKSR